MYVWPFVLFCTLEVWPSSASVSTSAEFEFRLWWKLMQTVKLFNVKVLNKTDDAAIMTNSSILVHLKLTLLGSAKTSYVYITIGSPDLNNWQLDGVGEITSKQRTLTDLPDIAKNWEWKWNISVEFHPKPTKTDRAWSFVRRRIMTLDSAQNVILVFTNLGQFYFEAQQGPPCGVIVSKHTSPSYRDSKDLNSAMSKYLNQVSTVFVLKDWIPYESLVEPLKGRLTNFLEAIIKDDVKEVTAHVRQHGLTGDKFFILVAEFAAKKAKSVWHVLIAVRSVKYSDAAKLVLCYNRNLILDDHKDSILEGVIDEYLKDGLPFVKIMHSGTVTELTKLVEDSVLNLALTNLKLITYTKYVMNDRYFAIFVRVNAAMEEIGSDSFTWIAAVKGVGGKLELESKVPDHVTSQTVVSAEITEYLNNKLNVKANTNPQVEGTEIGNKPSPEKNC